jgi:hypothetical protein
MSLTFPFIGYYPQSPENEPVDLTAAMSKRDDAMPKLVALAQSSESDIVPEASPAAVKQARVYAQFLEAEAKVRATGVYEVLVDACCMYTL